MGIFFAKPRPYAADVVDLEAENDGEELCRSVNTYLANAQQVLELLQQYGDGCKAEIGKALSARTPKAEAEAFAAVVVRMRNVERVYRTIEDMKDVSSRVFTALSDLTSAPYFTTSLARVLAFALAFDHAKAHAPQLQNDLSFYKRMLSKERVPEDDERRVFSIESMSMVGLSLASTTPMLAAVGEGLPRAPALKNKMDVVASLANVCQRMVRRGHYDSEESNLFCLRAMVAAVLLYDHRDEDGAFHKKSAVDAQRCVSLLKSYSMDAAQKDVLLNALRYNAVTLNAPGTPSSIQKMLET